MAKKTDSEDVMKQVLDRIDRLDDKIEKKLDKVEDRLDTMDKTLVKQEENLKEHMHRTELAEKAISTVNDDLKPIKKHVAMLQGAFKLVGLVATIIAIIAGIAKLISGN